MGHIDDRLQELGLVLPAPMEPPGNFELVTVHDGLAYIAGHAPISGSEVLVQGAVGSDLTPEDGYRAARLTGLSILASLKDALGDLDRAASDEPGADGDAEERRPWPTFERERGECEHESDCSRDP